MEKLLREIFDDERIIRVDSVKNGDWVNTKFTVSFCNEGISAATQILDLCTRFKEESVTGSLDLTASIRFLV